MAEGPGPAAGDGGRGWATGELDLLQRRRRRVRQGQSLRYTSLHLEEPLLN